MIYHTIQKGDTLYNIAKRYGSTVDAILAANPQITNPSVIHLGQVIIIPIGETNLPPLGPSISLAWGQKVSPEFRHKVVQICSKLQINPSYLMACMAFEVGLSFDPSKWNHAGSGAVGLIQFMPGTAHALGTSTTALAAMSAVEQLDYVYQYFAPRAGQLHTIEDVYMTILWPNAIGKPNNYVLFDKNDPLHPKIYTQNAGLDYNHDGLITKAEATYKVRLLLEEGLHAGNASA
jgi:murein DD-endopeptidase MepM/ murein hydrolase activator NlpD